MVSASRSLRSLDLPEGSPIMPVPPPMSDDRAATGALQMRQQEHLQQVPHVQRGSARIEADVGAHRAGRKPLFQAFGARWTRPRQPSSSSRAVAHAVRAELRISLCVHPFMLATA